MNKLIFIGILALVSANIFATPSNGNPALGKLKAQICAGCHGVGGNSVVPLFPKLAGQGQDYLFKQLRDFKSGTRKDTTMTDMIAALNEEDMRNIAAYYAAQPIVPSIINGDAKIIKLGQTIYRGGNRANKVTACIACHGPRGKGIPSAKFPLLASQHKAYIIKQLKLFRQDSINALTGEQLHSRTNDYEGVMISFTKSLTNAQIEAVAEYIAGLH